MSERLLFGEFLIQKNLVKANAILGLLIEQVRSQPSISEIVFQSRLLTEQQQLDVFRTQSINGWDYQQSCVELGFWTEQLAKQVLEKSAKSRMPIGQLIVAKGIMSFGELTKALDEFVGTCEAEGGSKNESNRAIPKVPSIGSGAISSQNTEVVSNKIDEAKLSNSDTNSNFTPAQAINGDELASYKNIRINKIDQQILSEFFEVILKTRGDEIGSILDSWPVKAQEQQNDLLNLEIRALTCEFESINAAAKFVRAEGIVHFTEQMNGLFGLATQNMADAAKLGKIVVALKDGVKICWSLRSALTSERSEGALLASKNGHEMFGGFEAKCNEVNS